MNHHQRFLALDQLLTQSAGLWQPAPFCLAELTWTQDEPALTQALLQLNGQQCTHLEQHPADLQAFLSNYIPTLRALPDLLIAPTYSQLPALPERWSRDIPGRKWQQIQAFIGRVPLHTATVIDWCAGKAHLGRSIAKRNNSDFIAIERNDKLLAEGELLARKLSVPSRFICADVMRTPLSLPTSAHWLALHACGDLHIELLRQAIRHDAAMIQFSPCCYHLTQASCYQPLSARAASTILQMDRSLLHLSVEETVTSSARLCAQRDRMMAWRLAFDIAQRQWRNVDSYITTPSRPYSALAKGFIAFMQDLARAKDIAVPAVVNWTELEFQGQQRWQKVRRLQLLRHGFRQALEHWLLLDRALYLEEQGYDVLVYAFCTRELTPRQWLIEAKKSAVNSDRQEQDRAI